MGRIYFLYLWSPCANEFIGPNGPENGQFYDCPLSKNRRQYTGRYVMDNMGFPSNWIWSPIVVLIAFVTGLLLLAALFFCNITVLPWALDKPERQTWIYQLEKRRSQFVQMRSVK